MSKPRYFGTHLVSILSLLIVAYSHQLQGSDEHSSALRVGAWNLEHLNEKSESGCVDRKDEDYDILKQRIDQLDVDVLAIQEVESETAAYRVFDENEWKVVMSMRPNKIQDTGPTCRQNRERRLRYLGTGFALKKDSVQFETLDSYEVLDTNGRHRWGTDIKVHWHPVDVRLLSVHLASGCWGQQQDDQGDANTVCPILREQVNLLRDWIEERTKAKEQFIILGDFNRRLAIEGDWAREVLINDALGTVLVTEDVRDGMPQADWCDARYGDLIDHLIASKELAEFLDSDKVIEHDRVNEHPDHCLITAEFNSESLPVQTNEES